MSTASACHKTVAIVNHRLHQDLSVAKHSTNPALNPTHQKGFRAANNKKTNNFLIDYNRDRSVIFEN